jgi:hypothetical protein
MILLVIVRMSVDNRRLIMTLGRGNITVDVWWHWYNYNGGSIVSQCYLGPFDLFRLAFQLVNASCPGKEWSLEDRGQDPGTCVTHDGYHRNLQARWNCDGAIFFTLSDKVDEPNGLSKYFFAATHCELVTQPSGSQDAEAFHIVLFAVLLAFASAAAVVLYRKGHCDGVVERWHVGRMFDRVSRQPGNQDYELTQNENERVYYSTAEASSKGRLYGTI